MGTSVIVEAINHDRRRLLGTTAMGIAVAGGASLLPAQLAAAAAAGNQAELASLERANEWLNSPPLTAPALSGKVVLIDV
jgi:hypothetical protein